MDSLCLLMYFQVNVFSNFESFFRDCIVLIYSNGNGNYYSNQDILEAIQKKNYSNSVKVIDLKKIRNRLAHQRCGIDFLRVA